MNIGCLRQLILVSLYIMPYTGPQLICTCLASPAEPWSPLWHREDASRLLPPTVSTPAWRHNHSLTSPYLIHGITTIDHSLHEIPFFLVSVKSLSRFSSSFWPLLFHPTFKCWCSSESVLGRHLFFSFYTLSGKSQTHPGLQNTYMLPHIYLYPGPFF